MKNIVVLGGYGNFGKRIVDDLCQLEGITLFVAGRNLAKAEHHIRRIQDKSKAILRPLSIDIHAANFTNILRDINPFLVIHTSGPFQGQDYTVPNVCVSIGAHYIDLSDDRRFVCDITSLNQDAIAHNVLVVSGASSVPGLSSAVIDHYSADFCGIDSIDIAIAPGNKAERGSATVKGILSYTGHPFDVFKHGDWQPAYGWMDSKIHNFGHSIGKRYLANVDVPDLELFPTHYNVAKRVSFQAGLELPILHYGMVSMAYLAKLKIIKNWAPLSTVIVKASNLLLPFGTDNGAMEVLIQGEDLQQKPINIKWTLYAPNGFRPYIPTLSTVILARNLISGKEYAKGAMPCVNLLSLDEFLPYFKKYTLHFTKQL